VSDVFASLYASTYDDLYRDKDYAAEAAILRSLFEEHVGGKVASVLDLGAGTASHAVELARLGYDVVGVERSEAMLAVARAKTTGSERVELTPGDVRTIDLGRQFDAAISMFAVIGYQTEDEDVLAALATARRHLRRGGLLVFDVWYGPAVLADRPSTRFSRIRVEQGELLRAVTPQIDESRQLCLLTYELWRVADGRIVETGSEEHVVRYFFPNELRLLASAAGFSIVRISAFPDVATEPNAASWNALVVARAD
jgi:SAM-dependent methyltransferase